MELHELKKKGINAVFWNLSGTLIKQGITFIISIFLARLLSPSDFGLVGMATVFIAFTQGFSDLGLSSGLIRTKEPTESQYSSVFLFNLAVSFLLAIGLFASAGFIAAYYKNIVIKPIVQFVSYSFIIYALTSVHQAILYKNLEIKITRLASIAGALISGIVGILLALKGYGVWSLVYSGLIGSIVSVIIFWSFCKWRPKLIFNFSDIKSLMPFGIRVFLINYLDQVYSRLDVLIIGRIFSPAILGQYYRASSFNQLITKYSSQGLSGVFFPVISKIQDDKKKIQQVFNKTLHIICFLSFLITGLLYINAEPLILLLFGQKWIPAVHYFQILAFSSYVYPMSIIFNGILLGTNNSGNQLKLEFIKKGLGVAGLGIGFLFGMDGYLWSLVVTSTFGLMLSLYYIRKAIAIPILKNVKQIYTYALPLFLAGFTSLLIKKYLPYNLWLYLIVCSTTYLIIYLAINHLFRKEGYLNSKRLITEFILARIT